MVYFNNEKDETNEGNVMLKFARGIERNKQEYHRKQDEKEKNEENPAE